MFISQIIKEQQAKNKRERQLVQAKNIGIGLTVGAALGVLLAPKAGKETRDEITEKSKFLVDNVKHSIDDNIEKFKDIGEEIKERASQGLVADEESEETLDEIPVLKIEEVELLEEDPKK